MPRHITKLSPHNRQLESLRVRSCRYGAANAEAGLVEMGAGDRVQLTQRGLRLGEDIAARHRLAEWIVTRLVGMDPCRSNGEAHRLEHAMLPKIQLRLVERPGFAGAGYLERPILRAGQPADSCSCMPLDAATADVDCSDGRPT